MNNIGGKEMITIKGVTIALTIGIIFAFVVILFYNHSLKKNSPDPAPELSNTDILLADVLDEIKIICK